MAGGYQFTSDSVAEQVKRELKTIQGAGTDKAIGSTAPTKYEQQMGRVGQSRMISLAIKGTPALADVTITLWIWCEIAKDWFYGGANSNDYTKNFAHKGYGGFRAPLGAAYFLTSSAEVDQAWVADSAPSFGQYKE